MNVAAVMTLKVDVDKLVLTVMVLINVGGQPESRGIRLLNVKAAPPPYPEVDDGLVRNSIRIVLDPKSIFHLGATGSPRVGPALGNSIPAPTTLFTIALLAQRVPTLTPESDALAQLHAPWLNAGRLTVAINTIAINNFTKEKVIFFIIVFLKDLRKSDY